MCGFQAFQFPCQRLRRTEGKGNPPQPTFSSRIDNLTPSPRVRFSSWSSGGAAFQVNEPLGQTVPNSWMFVIIWVDAIAMPRTWKCLSLDPPWNYPYISYTFYVLLTTTTYIFFNRIQTVKYRQCLERLSKKVMSKFFKCLISYIFRKIIWLMLSRFHTPNPYINMLDSTWTNTSIISHLFWRID